MVEKVFIKLLLCQHQSIIFLLCQTFVRVNPNILFLRHCVLKQNIQEASCETSYKVLNGNGIEVMAGGCETEKRSKVLCTGRKENLKLRISICRKLLKLYLLYRS